MKRIIFMGRSECGKTTLTQAMRGETVHYHKTQYINFHDVIIDTPGEYAENKSLATALALYSYEADVVGLLVSAIEPYTLYPPNITCLVNRDVIGIVTKIDHPQANIPMVTGWLENSGCKTIFYVNSKKGEGVRDILEYLKEEDDLLPPKRKRTKSK